jgi:hypothetical protein
MEAKEGSQLFLVNRFDGDSLGSYHKRTPEIEKWGQD